MSDKVKVRYDGPFDAVEVPEAGAVCERGKSIEVDADLAERMLEQDVWKKSGGAKREEGE